MRIARLAGALVGALSLALGCDGPRSPTAPNLTVSTERAGSGGCPRKVDHVATSEETLLEAIMASKPGDVIGISGYFAISGDMYLPIDSVRVTCVTPGSGFYALPGAYDLLVAVGRHVVVDHLVLDGTQAFDATFAIYNDGVFQFAQDVRFANNTVTCATNGGAGTGFCLLQFGGTGTHISDNGFTSDGSSSGIHLQRYTLPSGDFIPIDGARVEGNTITATAPSTDPRFGAIRPTRGDAFVIASNKIQGPWANGISAQAMTHGRIESNRIDGASQYGVRLSSNTVLLMRTNLFRENQITGSGTGGMFVSLACGNVFDENDLRDNAGMIGMLLAANSGANIVRGDDAKGFLIIDDGAYDCDGDGVNDPNIIRTGDDVVHDRLVAGAASVTPAAMLAKPVGERVTARQGGTIE